MTPTTWQSLLFFAYFLIPGLYLDLLNRRHRSVPNETALAEIGRIVLASMFFSTLGFAFIALARWLHPEWMPDLRRILSESNYVSAHFHKIIWTLLTEELIALFAVWLYDNVNIVLKRPNYTTSDLMSLLLADEPPETVDNSNKKVRKAIAWILRRKTNLTQPEASKDIPSPDESISTPEIYIVAKVTLLSREEVVGFPKWWSSEESMSEREIILEQVADWNISFLPAELQALARRDSKAEEVYIPVQSIEKISTYKIDFRG